MYSVHAPIKYMTYFRLVKAIIKLELFNEGRNTAYLELRYFSGKCQEKRHLEVAVSSSHVYRYLMTGQCLLYLCLKVRVMNWLANQPMIWPRFTGGGEEGALLK